MGSQKPSTWSVTLKRDGQSHPWGFRLAGGADLNTPLIVTKVYGGSPSERSLRVGDIIRKIESYDARDLRHSDAQKLISNADQSITLAIERDAPQFNGGGISSSIISSPTSFFSAPDGGVHIPPTNCPVAVNGLYGYERAAQSPVNNFRRFPPALIDPPSYDPNKSSHDVPTISQQQQPYRTNPLVLPGAKVKRDPCKAESYLRHHPNPMMRANPAHHDYVPMDTLMKQKVVHKQFNTPIGLYSEENIANSIKTQTGYTPKFRY